MSNCRNTLKKRPTDAILKAPVAAKAIRKFGGVPKVQPPSPHQFARLRKKRCIAKISDHHRPPETGSSEIRTSATLPPTISAVADPVWLNTPTSSYALSYKKSIRPRFDPHNRSPRHALRQLSGNKQLEIHRTGGRVSCGIKIGTTRAGQQANKEHQTDAKTCIERFARYSSPPTDEVCRGRLRCLP